MKGEYYSPMPLDFELLSRLPDQGTIGGVHWRGLRAKDVRRDILEAANGGLTSEMLPMSGLQSRLRSMAIEGLVQSYPAMGASGLKIWARTPKGAEFLEKNRTDAA